MKVNNESKNKFGRDNKLLGSNKKLIYSSIN